MPRYEVQILCPQCGTPHSTHVSLELAGDLGEAASVAEAYRDRNVPDILATVAGNGVICPKGRRLVYARDLSEVFLVRAAEPSDAVP